MPLKRVPGLSIQQVLLEIEELDFQCKVKSLPASICHEVTNVVTFSEWKWSAFFIAT
jgi:hypothetical protein